MGGKGLVWSPRWNCLPGPWSQLRTKCVANCGPEVWRTPPGEMGHEALGEGQGRGPCSCVRIGTEVGQPLLLFSLLFASSWVGPWFALSHLIFSGPAFSALLSCILILFLSYCLCFPTPFSKGLSL